MKGKHITTTLDANLAEGGKKVDSAVSIPIFNKEQLHQSTSNNSNSNSRKFDDLVKIIIHSIRGGARSFLITYAIRAGIPSLIKLAQLILKKKYSIQQSFEPFFRSESLQFGAMFGSFTFLWRLINNFMICKRKKQDSVNGFVSGFIGAAVSLSFLNSREMKKSISQQMAVRAGQAIYNSLKAKSLFSFPHGDSMLFMLSCASIMYGYIMAPQTIPREYYSWMIKTAKIPKNVLEYNRDTVRNIKDSKNMNVLSERAISLIKQYGKRNTTNAIEIASKNFQVNPNIVSCAVLHPTHSSCTKYNASLSKKVFCDIFPVYASLNIVPLVIFRGKSFVKRYGHLTQLYIKSYLVQLHLSYVLIYVFNLPTKKADIGKHSSIFLEKKGRRSELAMYVLPKGVASLYLVLLNRGYLIKVKHFDTILHSLAMGTIMSFYQTEPEAIRNVNQYQLKKVNQKFFNSRKIIATALFVPAAAFISYEYYKKGNLFFTEVLENLKFLGDDKEEPSNTENIDLLAVEKAENKAFIENNDSKDQELEIPTKVLVKEIWRHLSPHKLLLFSIVTITSASALINIATPMLIGEIVTVVQTTLTAASPTERDFSGLNSAAIKLMGLFASQGLLTFIDIALVSLLKEKINKSLKLELYESLLRQDISFFDKNMQGQVTNRLTQDVSEFKSVFGLVITQGLKCFTQVVGSAIHLFKVSSKLSFALISTMPLLYVFLNFYGMYLRKLSRLARIGDGKANGLAGEAISQIRTVRAFANEDKELKKYAEATSESTNTNSHLGMHVGLFQGITNTTIGGMILIILYYGGKLVSRNEMTGGELMTYMIATQNAQKSLTSVGILFGQVIKTFSSASRIFEYIKLKEKISLTNGIEIDKSQFKGKIEFKNVNFVYPTRPNQLILKDFNLTLPVGSVVALCGQSGSGKSTIGQLLERFYEPYQGEILIDGIPIKNINPSWLRKNIGYINQEPTLFATSILENIRYGNENSSEIEVIEAAKKANAHNFIQNFPDGYQTMCGERGATLSGGQKQRIGIARAILKDPTILILDEATSALDSQSEKIVQEALDYLMRGRTVLVIAHRLSTIQNADLIVVMSGHGMEHRATGNILESGTHTQLMKKKGAYFDLINYLSIFLEESNCEKLECLALSIETKAFESSFSMEMYLSGMEMLLKQVIELNKPIQRTCNYVRHVENYFNHYHSVNEECKRATQVQYQRNLLCHIADLIKEFNLNEHAFPDNERLKFFLIDSEGAVEQPHNPEKVFVEKNTESSNRQSNKSCAEKRFCGYRFPMEDFVEDTIECSLDVIKTIIVGEVNDLYTIRTDVAKLKGESFAEFSKDVGVKKCKKGKEIEKFPVENDQNNYEGDISNHPIEAMSENIEALQQTISSLNNMCATFDATVNLIYKAKNQNHDNKKTYNTLSQDESEKIVDETCDFVTVGDLQESPKECSRQPVEKEGDVLLQKFTTRFANDLHELQVSREMKSLNFLSEDKLCLLLKKEFNLNNAGSSRSN
ncbi:ATP-binding cassette, sub-B (MDR TAP), member 8 [Lobulomyces angularis]|nr:ATP-binding cassette, sub-B (MDR TAP), member 8 [Lobulomyces angularis]